MNGTLCLCVHVNKRTIGFLELFEVHTYSNSQKVLKLFQNELTQGSPNQPLIMYILMPSTLLFKILCSHNIQPLHQKGKREGGRGDKNLMFLLQNRHNLYIFKLGQKWPNSTIWQNLQQFTIVREIINTTLLQLQFMKLGI